MKMRECDVTPKQIIMVSLNMDPQGFSTEDAKLKAAARKLRDEGVVNIETYAANTVKKRGLQVIEGYHITLRNKTP